MSTRKFWAGLRKAKQQFHLVDYFVRAYYKYSRYACCPIAHVANQLKGSLNYDSSQAFPAGTMILGMTGLEVNTMVVAADRKLADQYISGTPASRRARRKMFEILCLDRKYL